MDLRIEFLTGSWLVYQGLMPAAQMLSGLPHPSGANSERIQYFLGRKDASVCPRRQTLESWTPRASSS